MAIYHSAVDIKLTHMPRNRAQLTNLQSIPGRTLQRVLMRSLDRQPISFSVANSIAPVRPIITMF